MSDLSVLDVPETSVNPEPPPVAVAPVAAPVAAVDEVILDVTIPEQALDHWCWAAIAAGLGEAYGDEPRSQCLIASEVLETSCCPRRLAPRSSCDLPQPIDAVLGTHLRRRFEDPKHRTFAFVRAQISRGFPIVVRIDWNRPGAGHFVVIAGYRDSSEGRFLWVCDPGTGDRSKVQFTRFLSYYRQKGFWDISYETKGRRPVPRV
jgi:Peptidase_C39 like family